MKQEEALAATSIFLVWKKEKLIQPQQARGMH